MAVMDIVARTLGGGTGVTLSDVAGRNDAKAACKDLFAAAQQWLRVTTMRVRHIEAAHHFASMVPGPRPADCLRALLQYHEVHGGGLRWFVLRDGEIEPRTPPRAVSSRYRFRLWSLCRLGVQCGVLKDMPEALLEDDEAPAEDSDE
jgi:hypothetical protein